MSTRALRKLQGGPNLPNSCLGDEKEEEEEEEGEEKDEQPAKETLLLPSKGPNRFDLLVQGSPSESEVKEDDDVTENSDFRDDCERDGASPQPPVGSGAKRKRKKKKKRGRVRVPASSEDPTDNDKDDIDNIIEEVNAITSGSLQHTTVEKTSSHKPKKNLLTVEHKHLNPQNEMKRIFGSRVVQASENNRRRGRTGKSGRSTWIVPELISWTRHPRPGISMGVAEATQGCQAFKYVHSQTYQQCQFRFLDAVESLNPENIMMLLNQEPFHVDTLLQVSEIFRLGDDSAMAAQLIERALFILESVSHPLFNITTGGCRLHYQQQENRSLFIALFRHTLNVGQKGCYRTALELCKLLLNLSPDEDPLAVTLMIDFYALRAQEYSWMVAFYDTYEPTKNLSQLPNFSFSVPLALFHLSTGGGQSSSRDKREATKAAALAEELGGPEAMRERADDMLQRALIMFPGLLLPLLDKCSIQPDPEVASHAFFGAKRKAVQSVGLGQLFSLYVGRCFHAWKEAGVMSWLEENVKKALSRVDQSDPLVKEAEEAWRVRYQGTPVAIYRHILMSEIRTATAALPPALANTPVMSYDPLPPRDSVCGYTRPTKPVIQPPTNTDPSNILTTFFRSLLPNYNPETDAITEREQQGAERGAEGEGHATGDLRVSVNTLLDAMRDLLSNLHLPEPPGNEADDDEEDDDEFEWD
ncbi:Transcription factor 25 [Chionoecetes opilio]|uniref:Transcription factor 25 n=1 Tax=Chionoecetes opilio TaxID=41210 RepID=A0A8J4YAL2_CHIOP|nr:Transcription factor 25 [Chionoecetes opilio]